MEEIMVVKVDIGLAMYCRNAEQDFGANMRRLTRAIVICVAVCVGSISTASAGGNTGTVKISELALRHDGYWVKVEVDNGIIINPDGCEGAGFYAYTEPGPDLLAALLSAFHSQTDVQIYLNGCTAVINGSTRPKISTITIQR